MPCHDALWRTIGNPHAHGGEGGRQRPFGSFAQVDASPLRGDDDLLQPTRRADRGFGACAAACASRRKSDIARIDFLLLGDPTAHFRPRASSPWRNGADGPCLHPPAPWQTEHQGADAVDLGRAISGFIRAAGQFAGTRACASRRGRRWSSQAETDAGRSSPEPGPAPASATAASGNWRSSDRKAYGATATNGPLRLSARVMDAALCCAHIACPPGPREPLLNASPDAARMN